MRRKKNVGQKSFILRSGLECDVYINLSKKDGLVFNYVFKHMNEFEDGMITNHMKSDLLTMSIVLVNRAKM